jgi:hypothetical protein
LLKDSLPLIDKSVKDYIDQVNNVLNSQIDHLECAVLGTGETLGADLKNAISLGNALPEPVQKLSADRDTVILSFLLGDKPTKYERSYSDLLYRAATTACQVGVAPEAVVEVSKIQVDVRPRWHAWFRLADTCSEATSCYANLSADLTSILAKSDARDIDAVNGSDRIKALVKPPVPGFFEKWDPTRFENALIEMLSVKDGIEAARLAREGRAASALSDATKMVETAETNIDIANKSISSSNVAANDNAIAHAKAASDDSAKFVAYLKVAVELSARRRDDAIKLSERYAKAVGQQASIIKAANDNKSSIARAEMVRAVQSINRGWFPELR